MYLSIVIDSSEKVFQSISYIQITESIAVWLREMLCNFLDPTELDSNLLHHSSAEVQTKVSC